MKLNKDLEYTVEFPDDKAFGKSKFIAAEHKGVDAPLVFQPRETAAASKQLAEIKKDSVVQKTAAITKAEEQVTAIVEDKKAVVAEEKTPVVEEQVVPLIEDKKVVVVEEKAIVEELKKDEVAVNNPTEAKLLTPGLAVQGEMITGPLTIMKGNKIAPNTRVRFVSANGVPTEYTTDANGKIAVNLNKNTTYSVEFPDDVAYGKSTFVPIAHKGKEVAVVMQPKEKVVEKIETVATEKTVEEKAVVAAEAPKKEVPQTAALASGLTLKDGVLSGGLTIMKGAKIAPNTKVRFVPAHGAPIEYTTDAAGKINVKLSKGEIYTVEFPNDPGFQKSTFVPSMHQGVAQPLAMQPKEVLSANAKHYRMQFADKKAVANKHFMVIDKGRFSLLQKTDAQGKMPKGFTFSDKAKIYVQDKGVVYVKNIMSLLSNDTLLTLNTSDKTVDASELPEEVAALLLDDYADEVIAATKVEANQTKVVVRIQNLEIIPSKLLLMEGTTVKKELNIDNNMIGFGVLNDKKYSIVVKSANYKDFTYSFEPKSVLKDGRVVIKAQMDPLPKEAVRVKKTLPQEAASAVKTSMVDEEKEVVVEKIVSNGIVQDVKVEAPQKIMKDAPYSGLGWRKEGDKANARLIAINGSSILKNESFVLKNDQVVIGTLRSDSAGVLTLKGLEIDGIYTLEPSSDKQMVPFAFTPTLELPKNAQQMVFSNKASALTNVVLDNEIPYEIADIEAEFSLLPAGVNGTERVVGQVLLNNKRCADINVEIMVDGKLQSLTKTNRKGVFVAYMDRSQKNVLGLSINESNYKVPLTAKDFVLRRKYAEVTVNIDDYKARSVASASPLSIEGAFIQGPLEIMKGNQLAPNTRVRFIPAHGAPIEYTTDANGKINLKLAKDEVYSVEFPDDMAFQKSAFVPFLHSSKNAPLSFKAKEGLVSKVAMPYQLKDQNGHILANKSCIVMDKGGFSSLLKTDANGHLPPGFAFTASAKIIVQEKGVVYTQNIASSLSADSVMAINTSAINVEKSPLPEEISDLVLDEYAAEIEAAVPVSANQSKMIVRIQNAQMIGAKLIVSDGVNIVKELTIENNMIGFTLPNDKKYTLSIKADSYRDYNYSFAPKAIAKDGRIVIKATLIKAPVRATMEVIGIVTSANSPLFEVDVRVFEEGETFGRVLSDHDGAYSFVLKSQTVYSISVRKDGFESKQYSFIPKQLIETTGKLEVNFDLAYRQKVKVSGQVMADNKPVSNALVQVYDEDLMVAKTKTDTSGKYELELREKEDYVMSVTKEGFFQNNFSVVTKEAGLQEMNVNSNVKLEEIVSNKSVQIPNIYFDYKVVKLTERSIVELDRLVVFLKLNPNIKLLEILAHTDEVGSNEYNLALSKKRADVVVEYLIKKGIPRQKLSPRGLGEEDLVVRNATTDFDSERNRRTEFRVILQ